MFNRLILIVFISVMCASISARADDVKLEAAAIKALLSGNTVSGTWGGSEYKQFFDASGVTVYVPANGRADEGKWRVNAQANTYESWWQSTGWTPYEVTRDGDTYSWKDKSGSHPFVVLKGKQVTW